MTLKIEFIYIFLLVAFLSSCNEDVGGGMKVKPSALGRMNEIVVLADKELWESPVQDTFDYYFGSAYPIMPQPEPMFDIRHFNLNELDMEPLRKELRTYVLLADLSNKDSRTTKMVKSDLGEARYQKALLGEVTSTVGKDKWARGQLVIYLMGKDSDALNKVIKDSYPALSRRVNQHDEEQLRQKVYGAKTNLGLSEEISEKFGVKLDIPTRYQKAMFIEEENFIWMRKDDQESVLNIIVRKFPYRNQEQLSVEAIKKRRNEYGKKYISTTEEGSYMVINDVDLPVFDYTYNIDGKYTRELRGVWEMENDFLGGPFATYAILNEEKGEIVFIDTFIYAPGKEKRNMMQELEFIVKHATFPG
jgi:hypothetical protein